MVGDGNCRSSQSRPLMLLNYDGWGHGAYFKDSACVVSAVDRYLLTRRTPPPNTHCAAVESASFGVQANPVPLGPLW